MRFHLEFDRTGTISYSDHQIVYLPQLKTCWTPGFMKRSLMNLIWRSNFKMRDGHTVYPLDSQQDRRTLTAWEVICWTFPLMVTFRLEILWTIVWAYNMNTDSPSLVRTFFKSYIECLFYGKNFCTSSAYTVPQMIGAPTTPQPSVTLVIIQVTHQ